MRTPARLRLPVLAAALALAFAATLPSAGCLSDFSNPGIPPGCGNGVLDPGELCDGTEFGGNTCGIALGTEFGQLQCTEACLVDLSDCHDCGNGVLDAGEDCDDENSVSGDGCASRCAFEPGWNCEGLPSVCAPICGDGLVVGPEGCDDENTEPGDGCDADCATEPGWVCSGEPSVCQETCGDGVLDGPEACDDGNLTSGDGCSPSCVVEAGWQCEGAPSVCVSTCGDGVLAGGEGCDDGNEADGDGCSAACNVEQGWSCNQSEADDLSVCVPVCGDGRVVGTEECDDGNAAAGDGCAADCSLEDFSACSGSPSLCTCVVYADVNVAVGPASDGSSWANAVMSVRQAVQVAGNRAPCEVWVAEGTYHIYETGVGNSVQLENDVALYGGFTATETWRDQRDPVAHVTVLSGEAEGSSLNQVRHVIESSAWGALVDGFTITRGNNNGGDGAGLLVDGGDLILRDCIVTDNQAEDGGGMAVLSSTVTVQDCQFTDNLALQNGGAIALQNNGVLIVERSLFEANVAQQNGGGFSVQSANGLTVDRSVFQMNSSSGWGGGIRVSGLSAAASVTRSVFWGNVATNGGAGLSLYQLNQVAEVTNCTFANNDPSPALGASLRIQAGDVQVVNSILWGPTADQIRTFVGGGYTVEYSVVAGGDSSPTVLDSDPVFVSEAVGDLRLQLTSPCIDVAHGDLAPALDADGLPLADIPSVPNGNVGNPGYADMGAYERQP